MTNEILDMYEPTPSFLAGMEVHHDTAESLVSTIESAIGAMIYGGADAVKTKEACAHYIRSYALSQFRQARGYARKEQSND
jgi:hypothetical protein